MATPSATSNENAMGSMTTDYAQYGASTDPITTAIAQLLAKMLGGGGNQIKDALMMVQAASGIENKGVTMGANVLAGIQRNGASTLMGEGSGSGMVGGRDIISFQAAAALQQQMLRHYTNTTTGAPTAAAHGLDVAQLGQVANQVLSQGGGYSVGPVFKREVLDQKAIDRYTEEGRKDLNEGRGRGKLDEALKMKPGDMHVSMTQNADKLMAMFDDGAKTMASVKEILTSEQLKNLDAATQTLFGGSMQEFGNRAARMKMASIKAQAAASFGGNVQEAAAFDQAAMLEVSGALGGPGMSPEEAAYKYGHYSAKVSQGVTAQALAGGRGQRGLAAQGIYGRERSDVEIKTETAEDVAAYTQEEETGVALAALSQRYAGTMTPEQKKAVAEAMTSIGKAGTAKELQDARDRGEAVISDVTGGNGSGGLLANLGGTEKAIQDLRGPAADKLAQMTLGALGSRNQANLRSQYEDDTDTQHQLGLGAQDTADLGMGASNLTVKDLGELRSILDEGGPNKDAALEEFLGRGGVTKDLESAGVSKERFMKLLQGQTSGGALGALKGMSDTYEGTGNFAAAGDVRAQNETKLAAFMTEMQGGHATNTGDLATELLKGFTGDKGISDATLIAKAKNAGGAGLLELSKTGDMLDTSDENLKKLGGVKGLLAHLGLEEGDTAGLKEVMGSAGGQVKLAQYLSDTGAMNITDGKLTYLDEEQTKAQTQAAEDEARGMILGGDFKRKEDETDEEASKRFSKEMDAKVLKTGHQPGYTGRGDGQWNENDSLVHDYGEGDKDKLGYLLDNGVLSKGSKETLKKSLAVQLADASRIKDEAKAKGDTKKASEYGEQQANLYELMDRLNADTGGGGGVTNANTVTVNATTVNVGGERPKP